MAADSSPYVRQALLDYQAQLNDVSSIEELWELLSNQCINAVAQPGRNDHAVEFWVKHFGLDIPRARCMDILQDISWSEEELEDMTNQELNEKVLWCACWHDQ
jgi:hypothetical protein